MQSSHPVSSSNYERLFHVSDKADITCFYPRPSPSEFIGLKRDVVFAISAKMLHNYLFPRDCPRVTWYAGKQTTDKDRLKFTANSKATYFVAVESGWYNRIKDAGLYLYEFPGTGFELLDDCAGYYISYQPVVPLAVSKISDIIGDLLKPDVELRFTPLLTDFAKVIAESSLNFSLIRMRNARR